MMSIPVGYHFRVDFLKMPSLVDIRFQEVGGISTTLTGNEIKEGTHTVQLAKGIEHQNLILKRGMVANSMVSASFNVAMTTLKFTPQTVMVTLLNKNDLPTACWWFLDACPKKWSISDFNADANNLVIETLEFTYKNLKTVKI